MASIRPGERVSPTTMGRENPLLHIANKLVDHIKDVTATTGNKRRNRIGLAGGNPSHLHVFAVEIRWNRRRRTPDGGTDGREVVTVFDKYGEVPTRIWFLPYTNEIGDEIVAHVIHVWKSRSKSRGKSQINTRREGFSLPGVPGEDDPGLSGIAEVKDLYRALRSSGMGPFFAFRQAKRVYLGNKEYEKRGITPSNYRKLCSACGRTGQVHYFNNECDRWTE